MSFLPAARAYASTLPPSSSGAILFNYLIANAVGSSNAATWDALASHLASHGIVMSQQTFQHGLLADSRSLACFIGSYDKGKKRGYFIIDTIFDAELMRDWYLQRIAKETYHVNKLTDAAKLVGWTI